jgi:hypothetical protein
MDEAQRRYYDSVEQLPSSVSLLLAKVTIVGMKYYERNQAFDRIVEASTRRTVDQLLFLVQDVNNPFDKDAVMLHDGVKKLGHVAAPEASAIKKFLDEIGIERNQNHVIVVSMQPIASKDAFKWSTSFNVQGIGMIYERIARKYAQTINKP